MGTENVFGEDHSDDVPVGTITQGEAGETMLCGQGSQRSDISVTVDRDHVGAGNHHLADDGVGEFEDGVDQLPLLLVFTVVARRGRVRLTPRYVFGNEFIGGPPPSHGDRQERSQAVGKGPRPGSAEPPSQVVADQPDHQHQSKKGHHQGASGDTTGHQPRGRHGRGQQEDRVNGVDRWMDRIPVLKQFGDPIGALVALSRVSKGVGSRSAESGGESGPKRRRQAERRHRQHQRENHRLLLPWLARMSLSRSSINSASASS